MIRTLEMSQQERCRLHSSIHNKDDSGAEQAVRDEVRRAVLGGGAWGALMTSGFGLLGASASSGMGFSEGFGSTGNDSDYLQRITGLIGEDAEADGNKTVERPDSPAKPGMYMGPVQEAIPTKRKHRHLPAIVPKANRGWPEWITDAEKKSPKAEERELEEESWFKKVPKKVDALVIRREFRERPHHEDFIGPSEADRNEYMAWRKKVIACSRSLAHEVDRFRTNLETRVTRGRF